MKLFQGSRPLKRWRYVGVFSEELAVCAALVQIGPARQSFWALHLTGRGAGSSAIDRERTRLLPRREEVTLTHGRAGAGGLAGEPGRLRVRDRGVLLEVILRRTEWWWSAGVGEGVDGVALAWNLVSGVNDPPSGSERAVWVDGDPHETPPVCFATDLTRISCDDGSQLSFRAEAERARSDNLLIVRSDYRAPFGTFAGTLPGGIPLARGRGVVEHHRARW